MTHLLEKAFEEAAKLPSEDQDMLANWILETLASERQWDELFEKSHDLLAQMADEALAQFRAGKTQKLDPNTL